MAFSPTHPINSYIPKQPLTTSGFKAKLITALSAYYPENEGELPHYDSVSVLLLLWEDDHLDLKCGNEVGRLRDIFAKLYGHSTQIVKIPTAANHNTWLLDFFVDFVKDKTERDLVIIYYASHRDTIPNGSPCMWLSAEYDIVMNPFPSYATAFPQLSTQSGLHPPQPSVQKKTAILY
ncbi:hypothetical protein AJ80_05979 [Polytolypa hystricis UAMH7299]|uniref:Uncharacterized protein n=1 Tax=Polytolypa hystricis (strain UAMH7299) TaxID=1447883 RepID=A0A2B7XYZ1_POLH7|nr:hypothetical protein AJ80_05979 [Polytolypa hystricis UAMH7299]